MDSLQERLEVQAITQLPKSGTSIFCSSTVVLILIASHQILYPSPDQQVVIETVW